MSTALPGKQLTKHETSPGKGRFSLSALFPDSRELDKDWQTALSGVLRSGAFSELAGFVRARRKANPVFPQPNDVFRALQMTPLPQVRFVILGQDPYHGDRQAHGLAFSVPEGVPHPPSLRNILNEWQADTGYARPVSGSLARWAVNGGLLLNTVMTVDAHKPHSHRDKGWEAFTDQIIRAVSHHRNRVAFLLWGKPAQEKAALIDSSRHLVLTAPHPSPLSAWRGFSGSRPFSAVNRWRATHGLDPIDWSLE